MCPKAPVEPKIRVLTCSNCPAHEHLGSGYIISRFVNGLRGLGYEVDLLQPDDHEVFQCMRPRANGYRQAVGMLIALRKALNAKTYDIIEFWGGEAWLATMWLTRYVKSRPLIVQHTNGPEPRYARILESAGLLNYSALQRWHAYRLVPEAFRCADSVVAISKYDLQWLEEMKLPRGGNRIAIEVPLANEFLGRKLIHRDSRIFGYCGTWLAKKGLGVIIPDVTRLLREFLDWRFLVLGTNPSDQVQDSFPEDIRERIEVMPLIKDKESLARQYERMEIFLFPSVIESFGIALAEAMACGCAPAATRVGFAAALENGQHAILMEKPESPQLYDTVKRLILNVDLRRRIAINAYELVQSLRWENAIETLSAAYEQWLVERQQCAG